MLKKSSSLTYPRIANLDRSEVYVDETRVRERLRPSHRRQRHRLTFFITFKASNVGDYLASRLGHKPIHGTGQLSPRRPDGCGAASPTWLGLAALFAFWVVPGVLADHRDSFESVEPTWRLADADCGARIAAHRRDFQTFHTGQASEGLRLVASQGTYAYLVQEVPQSRVIAEWTAALWVKADRTGLQLLARVVLPRSRDPQTGGPMTVLLRGDVYDRTGMWQQLAIREADQLLERQVRVLRSQFGPDVDAREAYVDLMVVNAYAGAGVTNLWIDDLELLGQVPAARFASTARDSSVPGVAESPHAAETWSGAPGRGDGAQLNGTILLVAGRPFFPARLSTTASRSSGSSRWASTPSDCPRLRRPSNCARRSGSACG